MTEDTSNALAMIFVFGLMSMTPWVLIVPHHWKGTDRGILVDRMIAARTFGGGRFGFGIRRALVAGLVPATVIFAAAMCLVLVNILAPSEFVWMLRIILVWVILLCVVAMFVMIATVVLFNAPKVFVAPHYRSELGLLQSSGPTNDRAMARRCGRRS